MITTTIMCVYTVERERGEERRETRKKKKPRKKTRERAKTRKCQFKCEQHAILMMKAQWLLQSQEHGAVGFLVLF